MLKNVVKHCVPSYFEVLYLVTWLIFEFGLTFNGAYSHGKYVLGISIKLE